MKLRKVEIQNFRGIKALTLDVDDTTVLIGENNSGKTAVLEALRYCLREIAPRKESVFGRFDFHLTDASAEPASADPIQITVTFSEDAAAEWDDARLRRLRDVLYVDTAGLNHVAFRVTGTCDATTRELSAEWCFLDEAGHPRTKRADTMLAALRREVNYFYLTALREAGRHFDARGEFWRPFLRDSQLDPAKKAEIEAKLAEVNDLVVASHSSFGRASSSLKRVQEVVPVASGDIVSVEAVPAKIFDMLAKAQVQLATSGGAKIPVGRHGEGTQSLAVLLLFSAFLEQWQDRVPIVALEEPEAHLHPSAIRALWSVTEGIAGQKLVSTHSGDLLAEVPIDRVRRLSRHGENIVVSRLKAATLTADERRKVDYHIRHARGELLFARCWILVEGETEVFLISELARYLNANLERAGIRCVAHRHSSIELFIKVANDFGIRWCVLTDNDQQGRSDQAHVRAAVAPSAFPQALHVMAQDDLEGYLCSVGFGAVYQSIYDASPQVQAGTPAVAACGACGRPAKPASGVVSPVGTPAYWRELLKAIKKVLVKPLAAQEVVQMVRDGKQAVPPLIKDVIESALKLAGKS